MSSTETPGDGTQQVAPDIASPDAASPERTSSEISQDAVAADDAPLTGDVATENDAGPDAAQEAARDGAAPAPATSEAVMPVAGTADAPAPADAALPDPTSAATDEAGEPAKQPVPSPTTVAAGPAEHPPVPGPPPPAPAPAVSDPAQWGRVDDDGTVYVRTADGERAVGSWQAGEPAAGLAHYGRRFDDLATEVALLEARLKAHTGNPAEIKAKAQALADDIPAATAVGDLDGLAARARAMVETADSAAAESRAERAAARAAQVGRKEALAAEAEQIAAESTSWKAAGDRLKAIVEEWKTIRGIDRKTDEALWSRFAAARDAFGRRRGAHFASLDAQRTEARAAKQELIAEAQRLSTSTEWGPTSAAMRSLMDRWKAVPRTGRDGDDDLWKQFRAAQDAFFTARGESDKQRNAEQVANQQQKEQLLSEAERLDPSTDLRGAQNALRKIQERYDAIGHVPRNVMRSLEDRMQAVEQKVRGAADSTRARTAPENPMVTSMRAAVTKAEEQLAKAEAAGDKERIQEAKANLATRREWLAEAERAATRR
ncbi:MAG: hypothetical protein JWO98_4037 [Frankiales bacterium]|nr:hypothetical protein [Frankiales bacterium]